MANEKIFNLTNLTLLVALTLSSIAAYYSILGLMAIFAAVTLPIILMGSALEVSKVVTTVWLHKYWKKINIGLKTYLSMAVILLALLTSMGIFGFLSKAHIDQGVPTDDVAAKVSLIDEKIKTQRENIQTARAALSQMDAQVNARLDRGSSEQGAERAVQIRRQQQIERNKLLKEINDAQNIISKLNEERAPIASELRKVEAEVGPIKYIAALIYGDNPDTNVLEKAVRWVIILIVIVFDPLALVLVLAANNSRLWDKEIEIEIKIVEPITETIEPIIEEPKEEITEMSTDIKDDFNLDDYPYLKKEWKKFKSDVPLMVVEPEIEPEIKQEIEDWHTELVSDQEKLPDYDPKPEVEHTEIEQPVVIKTENVTREKPYIELAGGYVSYQGKHMHIDVLKSLHPELFLQVDEPKQPSMNFGTSFPKLANKADMYVRVDVFPNRVYKFDGIRWMEINKNTTDSYVYDTNYIQFLISKIDSGEYDVELLTDIERQTIQDYLSNQKT